MVMEGLAVEAIHLARRFGRRWAVVDVSFHLSPGQVMMVAGRNGSGKTTLLRMLATAIRPDAGEARVAGHDLHDREAIRRQTALLSHQSYLYESLTACENLDIVARFCGAPPAAAEAALQRVGLSDRSDDPVSSFSAGMRKRLSLARVLLQRPTIAFLDEPYGQLDPQGFALVEEVIGELKRAGATVLVATHQLERVTSFADRTLTLEAGRVA
jgi:heme exporter protein A